GAGELRPCGGSAAPARRAGRRRGARRRGARSGPRIGAPAEDRAAGCRAGKDEAATRKKKVTRPASMHRHLLALLITTAAITPAHAQQASAWPAKPLKLIIPFPGGGPTDIVGRTIGQKLTEAWGQNVVIDNRPGGGGVIGAQLAAKSPPDGYTMFL